MRAIAALLCFLTLFGVRHSTNTRPETTTFEAVETLMQTRKKPIVVFIYTSWCTYCKAMEASTFKDKKVAEKLNKDFYFIRLNAEEKRDISFLNQVFKYQPKGPETGVHELAQQLGSIDGKISFPTLCVLNEDYEITFQYNAYLKAKKLIKLLDAVLDNSE